MALHDYNELNDMHIDALREIGNIGSGNAASSLAMMLAVQVDISVPVVRILDYEQVMDELGGPEQMIVGLLLCLDGDVNGMIMFLLHQEFANKLLESLLGEDPPDVGAQERSTRWPTPPFRRWPTSWRPPTSTPSVLLPT